MNPSERPQLDVFACHQTTMHRLMHRFIDRYDAGLRLAEAIEDRFPGKPFGGGVTALGLGAVPVAGVIAARQELPLGVLFAESLVAPDVPHRSLGAVSEGDVVVVDARALARTGVEEQELTELVASAILRISRSADSLEDADRAALPVAPTADALLVSDGLADPLCILAAARALRDHGAGSVTVAAPMVEHAELASLAIATDSLVSVVVSNGPIFEDDWYADQRSVSDEEARTLLRGVRVGL